MPRTSLVKISGDLANYEICPKGTLSNVSSIYIAGQSLSLSILLHFHHSQKKLCSITTQSSLSSPSLVTINLVFVSKDLSHLHILNKLNTHPPIIHDGFFHLASCFKGLSTQHALVLHPLYGRRISQNSFFSAYLPVDRHLSLLSFDGYGVFC